MISSLPLFWIGLAAVLALLFVSIAVILLVRRSRVVNGPHILIGNKKVALRGTLRLGRTYWRSMTGKSVDDIAEDHAELFQAPDGLWEARLRDGEYMFVDGKRSRHNRLRPGAAVSLGRSERAIFHYFSG